MNKTPYDLILNKNPMLYYFRPFGCKYFIQNKGKNDLGKFDAKSNEAVLIGYSSTKKHIELLTK